MYSEYNSEYSNIRNQTFSEVNKTQSEYGKLLIIKNNCNKLTFGQEACRDDLAAEVFLIK